MTGVKSTDSGKLLGQPNDNNHFGGALKLGSLKDAKQDAIKEYARLALALHNRDPEVTSEHLAEHVATMDHPWISEGQKLAREMKKQQENA